MHDVNTTQTYSVGAMVLIMDQPLFMLLTAVVAAPLGLLWEKRQVARAAARGPCRHRWVYHSLYKEGCMWNRVCTFCRQHDTHWDDTPHPNWPPAGARIRRDDSMPNEEWRKRRAELKRLLDG